MRHPADANGLRNQAIHYTLATRDTPRGGFQDLLTDEASNPIFDDARGAQDIKAFEMDANVLGVIVPFESDVALAEIPIASHGHLALITESAPSGSS